VMDPETARACMLAGAQFIVSPSLNLKTIDFCRREVFRLSWRPDTNRNCDAWDAVRTR